MGDAKHTPGPWDVDEGDFSIYQLETGDQIAEMFGHQTPDEVEANARLMASAPDMLATIEALRAENARLQKDLHEYVMQAESGNQKQVTEMCELRKKITRLQQLNCELIRKDARDEVVGVLLETFGALKKIAALHRQQVNPSPETMDKIGDLIAAADEIVARPEMGESDD